MGNPTRVLLITRAGPLADGLAGLLISIPGVEIVGPVKRLSLALATVAELAPAMIIVESGAFAQKITTFVRELKAISPASRCIVIVDDVPQQQAAKAAGADAVLLKGCRPSEVLATVRDRSA